MVSFELRWNVSKGRDTYGYDICSLWQNGSKITSCSGGGYDMAGTCFAAWLKLQYADRLKKLYTPGFYGLQFVKKKKNGKYIYLKRYNEGCQIYLDGACGWSSMEKVAKAIKLTITQSYRSANLHVYNVIDEKGGVNHD